MSCELSLAAWAACDVSLDLFAFGWARSVERVGPEERFGLVVGHRFVPSERCASSLSIRRRPERILLFTVPRARFGSLRLPCTYGRQNRRALWRCALSRGACQGPLALARSLRALRLLARGRNRLLPQPGRVARGLAGWSLSAACPLRARVQPPARTRAATP